MERVIPSNLRVRPLPEKPQAVAGTLGIVVHQADLTPSAGIRTAPLDHRPHGRFPKSWIETGKTVPGWEPSLDTGGRSSDPMISSSGTNNSVIVIFYPILIARGVQGRLGRLRAGL
jgi:hypothetical protein